MYAKLIAKAKHYRLLVKINAIYVRIKLWLTDVRSALFSRPIPAKLTPYGFILGGTNSIHHKAMQEGSFEVEEVDIFRQLFEEADIFIDIGANIGFYTCLARSSNIQVLAVEPLEKNLKYLRENISLNMWSDVEVFPIGLSSESGSAILYGGSSTGASLISTWAGSSKQFKTEIQLSTLDELVADRFPDKKIFVKIDVEGAEFSVLSGSKNILAMKPQPTWILEICFNEYHPNGMNPHFEETFDLFRQAGYEAMTADSQNKPVLKSDVTRWIDDGVCDSGTISYKFVPVDR